MPSKSFNICVIVDVLDVTCPGVWICPKGMVYLDIWLFGCNSSTSYVEPKFPLAFNETFSFHESFTELTNLKDIQKCLEAKCMRIALVQVYKTKQITLATYRSNMDEVLYPERSRLSKTGEIALIMKNEPLFPGTISPKITLITKTSVTEQMGVISHDHAIYSSSRNLEKQYQPNRMKIVHHAKSTNPQCIHNISQRTSPNEETDSDSAGSRLYCLRSMKTNNKLDCECHVKVCCKYCEDINGMKITNHEKESSNQKGIEKTIGLKHKSINNDKLKNTEIKPKIFGKKIKATFKVGAHHNKCCKSKLNNGNDTNESIQISDEDSVFEEKCIRNSENEVHENSEHEPKKINPKIKAELHMGVHYCKCNIPNCALSPSWRNICHEVNRRDTVGDTIKYNVSLRNYYRRLYDGATYQLSRNLKLY